MNEQLNLIVSPEQREIIRQELLDELKQNVQDEMWNKPDGCICPVCDRKNAVYRIPFGKREALQMLACWRLTGGDIANRPYRVHAMLSKHTAYSGGAWSKIRHWGLIAPGNDEHERSLWTMTEAGMMFVTGRHRIHRAVYLGPNDKFLGYATDGESGMIEIRDALRGCDFDLDTIYVKDPVERAEIRERYRQTEKLQ